MKKIIVLLMVLALSLSLCACGKSKAVKAVEAQIDALGEVTIEDEAAVQAAWDAYAALLNTDQKKVKNFEKLVQAENTIQTLQQQIRKQIQQQVDQIVADNSPAEALPLLRQLEQTDYVRQQIQKLAMDLLKDYIRDNGQACDLLGEPKEDGDHLTVLVDSYQFVLDPADGNHVVFREEDNSAKNGMLLDGYKLHKRIKALYIYSYTELYSQTEHISKDKDFFHVSWNGAVSDASTMEELANLPVELDCSSYLYWPYDMSEEYLEENIHSNADDFVEEMDDFLQELSMPFRAWELIGIFE